MKKILVIDNYDSFTYNLVHYLEDLDCEVTVYRNDEFDIDEDSFFYFEGRTQKHTLIEISAFEGRSIEAKKKLYQLIFEKFEKELQISTMDVEITIFETPMHNWGIRGKSGDELTLNYKVNI